VPGVSSPEAFVAAYLDRARAAVGGRAVAGALSGRRALEPPPPERWLGGWWCRPDLAGVLVLPNPWDDRAAIPLFERHSRDLAGRVLARLAPALDELHGPRSLEWWRLVLQPWLITVVSEVLDRGLYATAVAELAPGATVLVPAAPLVPPASITAAGTLLAEDGFNGALVGALAVRRGLRTAPAPEPVEARVTDADAPLRSILVRHVATGLPRLLRSIDRGQEVTLLGQHKLTMRQLAELSRHGPSVRQAPRPTLAPGATDGPAPIDAAARARLVEVAASDAAEAEILALLPQLLPRTMVEDHARLLDTVRRRYGRPAHAVHAGYWWDDADNVYLAECRAAGRRIGFTSHGGSVHQLACTPVDPQEEQLGDRRLSWGTTGPRVSALAPAHLAAIRETHRGGDEVVMLEPLNPPRVWLMRFTSTPQGNQVYRDERLLCDFVERLGSSSRDRLVLKRFPGPASRRHPLPAALGSLPAPRRAALGAGAVPIMRDARLAVITYPDTPLIEALVLGVPTIGLWSADLWEMRADVEPLFRGLAEVGVIHHDATSAAAHLDAVVDDPAAWWRRTDVQAARAAFLARFGMRGDWRATWSEALRALAAAQPDRGQATPRTS
jgi:putative transferase (TIGR04331 family)